MIRIASITLAALFVCTLWPMPAGAQTLYRCGNKYQDRPCDAGQQGKTISGTPQAAARSGGDAECTQLGTDAQAMVWARESGKTAETMLTEIEAKRMPASQKSQQRQLVLTVYKNRGSAPEVAAAVQADCMAEKEKAAQNAALAAEVVKEQKRQGLVQTQTGGVQTSDTSTAATTGSTQASSNKAQCDRLATQLETNRSKARSGGNVSTMEALNRERDTIETRRRSAGC